MRPTLILKSKNHKKTGYNSQMPMRDVIILEAQALMQREIMRREENKINTNAKEQDYQRLKDAVMVRWDSKEPD